jgi:polar amino acid transport system substrate-binding protein
MSRTVRHRFAALTLAGAALTLVLAACSAPANGPSSALAEASAPLSSPQAAPAVATPSPASTCTPGATASFTPLASLPAPGAMPAESLEATIAQRGYLVVGVSGDTRLLGARNFLAGGRLEGFDIDIAKAVATAIFGKADDSTLRFKVITAAQRIPLVTTGAGAKGAPQEGVDMVARAMTMNCERWKQVAFSTPYFIAQQQLLVRSDVAKTTTIDSLAENKQKVCAPTGSTSLSNLSNYPGVVPVAVAIHSDCLALWQEGQVDAITGDNAILAGFAAQDPSATVIGKALEQEPYGLAISLKHKEFVKFVNAILASPAGRAAWTQAYTGSGLAAALPGVTHPAPDYGRGA